jgi:hypothetical protein
MRPSGTLACPFDPLSRDALRDLLIAGYAATLAKAFEIDPDAGQALADKARKGA